MKARKLTEPVWRHDHVRIRVDSGIPAGSFTPDELAALKSLAAIAPKLLAFVEAQQTKRDRRRLSVDEVNAQLTAEERRRLKEIVAKSGHQHTQPAPIPAEEMAPPVEPAETDLEKKIRGASSHERTDRKGPRMNEEIIRRMGVGSSMDDLPPVRTQRRSDSGSGSDRTLAWLMNGIDAARRGAH